jgi:chromatin assembly factor 1 subunit A
MNQLSEAEVAGDDHIVRQLLAKLQDRTLFPSKVFIFHEDARPGYYGTWTRSSRIIGPRRPLAKDLLIFDYGYDSGEEWEEEPAGEDVAEDDEEEEDAEEPDSDADSWLVDDDEEVEPVNLDDFDSLKPPEIWDLPPPPSKRKADDSEKKNSKKRKVVVPLVAFAKGPCWEERIGECSYDPFKAYRIQLFNGKSFKFSLTCSFPDVHP